MHELIDMLVAQLTAAGFSVGVPGHNLVRRFGVDGDVLFAYMDGCTAEVFFPYAFIRAGKDGDFAEHVRNSTSITSRTPESSEMVTGVVDALSGAVDALADEIRNRDRMAGAAGSWGDTCG